MRNFTILVTALTCVLTAPVFGQQRVDPRNRGERIIAVVPMTGAGTYADPRRPLFAPIPGEARRTNGIHQFSYQLSDDGQHAIVEFAARDRVALVAVLNDSRVVKAFEKGKHKKDDIERELKRYKKSFDLAPVGVRLP